MNNYKILYIGGAGILTAVIVVGLFLSNYETQSTQIPQEIQVSVTGTPADNYSEKERPTHCGTENPKSNSFITEYEIPTLCSQPLGIVVDKQNQVWFTQSNTGTLAKFEPKSMSFIEFENELWPNGTNSMMWGITYTDDDEIWFTDERFDTIWKFSIDEEKYYPFTFNSTYAIKFPQIIINNNDQFLINDFTGKKIVSIDHKKLDSGILDYDSITSNEDFITHPVIDKNGDLWFIEWKYQSKASLIRFDTNSQKSTTIDLSKDLQAPNGLAIDKKNNLWIADTATSFFLKFDPDTKQITKYVTSFPRESTFGNSTGLIKTPITRPYWIIADDEKLIFNEQSANMFGIFDIETEKLIEYLVPSKNNNWADCGNLNDCGLAQVFSFSKSGEKIWFTEWVENNIGVIDLAVPLPVNIELEIKEITLAPGQTTMIIASIIPLEGFNDQATITSSINDTDNIQIIITTENIVNDLMEIPIEISIQDDAVSGIYKVPISITQPDLTVSEFITVKVI